MAAPAKARCPKEDLPCSPRRAEPVAIDSAARLQVVSRSRLPSLERLLRLPAFQGAELICGHAQLKQPVTWVHVAEVMDIWRFLSGGELLLSTGLELIRVTPAARRAYIEGLSRAGVRALGLELVQWFTELPKDLLTCAREFDLPILVFRSEVSFRALTRAAHQEILLPAPRHGLESTMHTILAALTETGREQTFLQRELGPLLALPPRPRTTLLTTLESLLETHFNIAASARALGVRRQSVYYRMNQLNGLLGSLEDPSRNLGLLVAFAILRTVYPHLIGLPPLASAQRPGRFIEKALTA